MAVQPSKIVTDKQKSSLVLQSTREHLPTVSASLAEQFPRPVRPALAAAVTLIVGLFLDRLKAATDEMVLADEANARELGDDAALREARDAPAMQLREGLIDLRGVLITYFSSRVLPAFGIAKDTPTDPVVLSRAGAAALAHLRAFVPPKARLKSMRFDPQEWIEILEKPLADLTASLEEVAKDARQNQLTLTEKNRAIEAYDNIFKLTANLLVAVFSAAGRQDLADRVRPSTRRAGQTAELAPSISGTEPDSENAA